MHLEYKHMRIDCLPGGWLLFSGGGYAHLEQVSIGMVLVLLGKWWAGYLKLKW